MDILLIFLISAIAFFIVNFVSKKTKIAAPILYLILGIIFGGNLGICHIIGNFEILPNLSIYNTTALLLMFFAAGFSVNINSIKKSGKLTTQLFTIPAYVETILMSIVMFLTLKLFRSLGFNLSIFECAMICGILAVASPANVVPACVNYMTTGYSGKNNMPSTMLAVSVIDGFITLPVVMVSLVIAVGNKSGIEINAMTMGLIAVGVIIGTALIVGFGVLVGIILEMLFRPLCKKLATDKTNKKLATAILIGLFMLTAAIIIYLSKLKGIGMVFSTFGILIATAVGATIKHKDKSGSSQLVSQMGNMIFGIFGMPIIFMYVGSLININTLLNPMMLLAGTIISVCAFLIKGQTTKSLLKDERFTDGERKFAAACFVPKGVTLINFSLVLMPLMESMGLRYVVDFMIMLAAITILITMTIGVTQINSAKDKWLKKDEVPSS